MSSFQNGRSCEDINPKESMCRKSARGVDDPKWNQELISHTETEAFNQAGREILSDQQCTVQVLDLLGNDSPASLRAKNQIAQNMTEKTARLHSLETEETRLNQELRELKGRMEKRANKTLLNPTYNQDLITRSNAIHSRLKQIQDAKSVIFKNTWNGELAAIQDYMKEAAAKKYFDAQAFLNELVKTGFSQLRTSARAQLVHQSEELLNQKIPSSRPLSFQLRDETKVRIYQDHPLIMGKITSENQILACSLDARYGEGRNALRTTADVGLFFLTLGYGAALKAGALPFASGRMLAATSTLSAAALAKVHSEYERKCAKTGADLINQGAQCKNPTEQLNKLSLKDSNADCVFDTLMAALDVPAPQLKLAALPAMAGMIDFGKMMSVPEKVKRTSGFLKPATLTSRSLHPPISQAHVIAQKYPKVHENLSKIGSRLDEVSEATKAKVADTIRDLNAIPYPLPEKAKKTLEEIVPAMASSENWKNYSQKLYLESAEWIEKYGTVAEKANLKKGTISRNSLEKTLRARAAQRGDPVIDIIDGEFGADFLSNIAQGPIVDGVFKGQGHGGLTHFIQMDFVSNILKKNGMTHQEFFGVFRDVDLTDYWRKTFDAEKNQSHLWASEPERIVRMLQSFLPMK